MEQLPFTAFLNHFLAGPVTALLRAIGFPPQHPNAPVSNPIAMEILVAAILFLLFILVRASFSVEKPGALQHIFEGLHGFIDGEGRGIIGHHHEPYTAFVSTIFIFVLLCNLLGLVPGFESPTANPTVPLGIAICAFVYYHFQGLKKQGPVHYVAHFFGPFDSSMSWVLRAPLSLLMFPIELVSHSARVLSLTIRLYANMFAGDMVTLVFFSLVPALIPVAFLGLHIFVSLLQAYIFALLTLVYLAGAVAEEH